MAGALRGTPVVTHFAHMVLVTLLSAVAGITRDFIAGQGERFWVEYLPGYAPELNPVEYIWGYWKQHSLPNVCPKDYWDLGDTARQTLKRMRRRPRLITAFWQQAELSF